MTTHHDPEAGLVPSLAGDPRADWLDLIGKEEALDPELEAYLTDAPRTDFQCLKHPLVFGVPYMPALNASYNQQLRTKQALADQALCQTDWERYVWLHERPYRLDAFACVLPRLTSNQDYWTLLGSLWEDTENAWQNLHIWHLLLTADRPERHWLMSETDLATFRELPDSFTIYRGWHRPSKNRIGLSWTLSPQTAQWFASRYHQSRPEIHKVSKRTVQKEHCIAYLGGRGEEEILLDVVKAGMTTPEELTSCE